MSENEEWVPGALVLMSVWTLTQGTQVILLPIKLLLKAAAVHMCHLQQLLQLPDTNTAPRTSSLTQSFACQPYLLLLTPAPHKEEDREGHREASKTEDILPFLWGSATDSIPQPLPNSVLGTPQPSTSQAVTLPPADLLICRAMAATHPQRGSRWMPFTARQAIPLWSAAPSLPRLEADQATSWVGQLSRNLLLRLC